MSKVVVEGLSQVIADRAMTRYVVAWVSIVSSLYHRGECRLASSSYFDGKPFCQRDGLEDEANATWFNIFRISKSW